jgi:hypothetical protein
MKVILKLSLVILFLILSSCGSHRVYTTGSYGSIKSYTDKPLYKDEKESATYISGDVSFGSHLQNDNWEFYDAKTLLSGSIYRSTTGKFFNYYYGGGVTYGRYRFTKGFEDLIDNYEKHNFYNFNFKTGINFTYNRPRVEYRFVGVELTYLNEFGPYQNKLDELSRLNRSELDIINIKSVLTYNIYSEYVFKKPNSHNGLVLGFYFGNLLNYDKEKYDYRADYSGFSIGLKLNRSTISLISETGNGKISSIKLDFAYTI